MILILQILILSCALNDPILSLSFRRLFKLRTAMRLAGTNVFGEAGKNIPTLYHYIYFIVCVVR